MEPGWELRVGGGGAVAVRQGLVPGIRLAPRRRQRILPVIPSWSRHALKSRSCSSSGVSGRQDALDRLLPTIYDELRRLPRPIYDRERRDHTLQATALVHEAFLKLVDQREVHWQNRAHFFGIAAQMMRRILIDHARAHGASKRGSGVPPLSLEEALVVVPAATVDSLALDEALTRARAGRPAAGSSGRAAVLRRTDDQGDRRSHRHLDGNRRARLDSGQSLALCGAWTRNAMTEEQWPRVKELFHAALEHPTTSRSAFPTETSGGDTTLQAEVERLLAAHAQAGAFIEASPVSGILHAIPEVSAGLSGRVLGHYEVRRLIGCGGMGEVYEARDTELGRTVALKVVSGGSSDAQAALRHEAQHASKLNHPHVCTIDEVGPPTDRRSSSWNTSRDSRSTS